VLIAYCVLNWVMVCYFLLLLRYFRLASRFREHSIKNFVLGRINWRITPVSIVSEDTSEQTQRRKVVSQSKKPTHNSPWVCQRQDAYCSFIYKRIIYFSLPAQIPNARTHISAVFRWKITTVIHSVMKTWRQKREIIWSFIAVIWWPMSGALNVINV